MLNPSEGSERLIDAWPECRAPRIKYTSSSGVFQRGYEVVRRTSGSYTNKYRNCEAGKPTVTLNRTVSCDNSVQRNLFHPSGVTQPFFRKYIPCKSEESKYESKTSNDIQTPIQDGLDLHYRCLGISEGKGNLQQTPAMSLPCQINKLPDYETECYTTNQRNILNNDKTDDAPKKQSKLKRRKAYYKQKKEQGRSRSLTHIDALDNSNDTMVNSDQIPTEGTKSFEELSKESADKYVTILIEGLNNSTDVIEEEIAVGKGGPLREFITNVCEPYHIDPTSVTIHIADSNAHGIDQNQDISNFVRKRVILKVKDSSPAGRCAVKAPSIKKVSSGSYRAKTNRFFHVSSEEPFPSGIESPAGSADGSLKLNKTVSKQSNRWSGFFSSSSKDKDKMDILTERLNQYSKYGIPSLPRLQQEHTNVELQEILWLESDWKVIVNHTTMDERIHQQQSAIWELVQTEATYINTIRVVTDLFLKCLASLQNDQSLVDIDIDLLFSNIQDIYEANLTFWIDHILPMLIDSRKTKCSLDPTKMMPGFSKFKEVFKPYMKYCLDQSRCQLYCKEKDQDNGCFKTYLAWCETQKDCQRLRLVDILVKPMQRLTKYSLLLKAILKKTTVDSHSKQLETMIECVQDFVKSVNTELRKRHDQQKLLDIMTRVEAYDVIETKDEELDKLLRGYTELDLTLPIPDCPPTELRSLLKEGDLRLKEHGNSKDVHCFLFTDLLLLCKSVGRKSESKVKIIRQPYRLDRLIIGELKDPSSINILYLNDYRTVAAAFTLNHSESRIVKIWHEQLRKSQEQLLELKVSHKTPMYLGLSIEDDNESDPLGLLVYRSYKSSAKASRMSSLMHSHSGSMEIADHICTSTCECPPIHRAGNTLADFRSHSHSSDEGLDVRYRGGGSVRDIPARLDRRCCACKHRDTNTLSVEATCSGQSLPNLNVESSNSLTVPSNRLLSATQRGISYPPPSPRSLKRSSPVPQSRNPPLVKSRPISESPGFEQSSSFDNDIPVPMESEGDYFEEICSRPGSAIGLKRTYRPERLDNRRYHTAGAIEDIKRQDNRDPSIHKRLSLNYGQHLQQSQPLATHLSSDSVQSSSGVSSVGSAHLSLASELTGDEDLLEEDIVSVRRGDSTKVKIDISEIKDGVASVKISMNNDEEGAQIGLDPQSLRDLILNDASIEASEV